MLAKDVQGELLSTKLMVPPLRPTAIDRPRLHKRLDSAKQFVLITAHTGYGKSTLVSNWIKHTHAKIAWLSLDTSDNNAKRFWLYVVTALQQQDPKLGHRVLAGLQNQQSPPIKALVSALINDLSKVTQDITLVFDDYHLIQLEEVHETVNWFIDYLPSQIRLIIVSRKQPSLPLARLRAKDLITELGTEDLRFNKGEIHEFFNLHTGIELKQNDLDLLEDRSEGWAAGLQLAALAFKPEFDISSFIDQFSGSHRYIVDYLASEVLANQEKSCQDFLLKTSILERFCSDLCQAVTSQNKANDYLKTLEATNAFLIPLDNEGKWFRYHHLFRDVLLSQLNNTFPDSLQDLHAKASQWFQGHGLLEQAVHHALTGQLWEQAIALIKQQSPSLVEMDDRKIYAWLKQVPSSIIYDDPKLCLRFAWAVYSRNLLTNDKADFFIHRVQETLKETNDNLLKGELLCFQTAWAASIPIPEDILQYGRRALDILPESAYALRAQCYFLMGNCYMGTSQFQRALKTLEQCQETIKAGNVSILKPGADSLLSYMYYRMGKLHQSRDLLEEILEDPYVYLSWAETGAHLIIAMVYHEWNQLDKAFEHLEHTLKLNDSDQDSVLFDIYSLFARLYQAKDETQKTEEALAKASLLSKKQNNLFKMSFNAANWAEYHLSQGALSKAIDWAKNSKLSLDNLNKNRSLEYMVFVKVLIADKKHQQANELLDKLLLHVKEDARSGDHLKLLILKTLNYAAQNEPEKAMASLECALELAEPEGFIRIFLSGGQPIAELLNQALSHSRHISYIRKLLVAFLNEPNINLSSMQGLVQPLSKQELSILQLLSSKQSIKDISQTLNLSLAMTKLHISNIYIKLDVASRNMAIQKAQELYLI